ncbi:Gag-pro-like protein [Cucumis melo var. makuwa]|uniref:Gag-pro-like protein n=1 Tax=Cucumis melo var. makuwa TaxID=1194695 RepID=A0A5D3CB67_CUCMM|nr:Gag-pro-like protein [Cucumis melo var. makuwa]
MHGIHGLKGENEGDKSTYKGGRVEICEQKMQMEEMREMKKQQKKEGREGIEGDEEGLKAKMEETNWQMSERGLRIKLRAIEGADMYGSIDATQLCLISYVVIPPKFKTPNFEKYNGTTCPKSHLVMYCRKMSAYAYDDKLLIHCFQDSLVGPTSRWYMQLDGSQVHRWKDLADSFLKQYKYNIDTTPDRLDL